MASTGLSTPLLAVHWYRIILSGVPGLLTFKTVMDDPWGKTLESPTRVHVITGEGFPEALQDNVTLLPSTIVRMVSEIFTNGATEENRTKHTMLEKILGKDLRVQFFPQSFLKLWRVCTCKTFSSSFRTKSVDLLFVLLYVVQVHDTKSHQISTNHENAHSTKNMSDLPTMVMLTVALCPVPTVLIGTQVYTPSASTVMFNRPELWLPITASLK